MKIIRIDKPIEPVAFVLQQYANSKKMVLATFSDKIKVSSHYKNFGSLNN